VTRLLIAALVVLAPWSQSSGRISGHVATTGEPGRHLARAYVSLVSASSSTRRLTMTREDGTFEFDGVPPGEYVVEAGKLPHVAGSERVVLSQGQSRTDLTFRLKRSGAISGTVLDERGQPARDVNVSAHRIRYERGGAMTTTAARLVASDRFGRYRISGLSPGAYVIFISPNVMPPHGATILADAEVDRAMQGIVEPRRMPAINSFSSQFRDVLLFVPGVTRAEAATVFVVDDGTEHANISAVLSSQASEPPAALGPIAGVVLGPDGRPIEADVTFDYGVTPIRISAGLRRVRTLGGRFKFEGPMSGKVRLTARVPNQPLEATLEVAMSGQPVTDITVRVQPPMEIAGRATDVATPASGRTIILRTYGGVAVETRTVDVKDTGEFRLSLFPGRYVIENGSAVTIDGRDMTDRVIEISHDSPIRNVAVSFSEDLQGIAGRVTNSNGTGVSVVTMVAFSTIEADWFHQARRIAIAEPATDGRYQLGGAGPRSLPAGDYYLAAVNSLSPDEQYNPAFLRTLVDAAIKVTVAPGQRAVQDVRVR
jgi:hypothetical protein